MTQQQASPDDHTHFVPPVPRSIEDTGLGLGFLSNLAIKVLYLEGDLLGYELAERMRLPHAGVVEDLLISLKQEKLCEVKATAIARGSIGLGRAAYG